jgi:hypothetical protein
MNLIYHILIVGTITVGCVFLNRWVYEVWPLWTDMIGMGVLSAVFWMVIYLLTLP